MIFNSASSLIVPISLTGVFWLTGIMFVAYSLVTGQEKGSIVGGFFLAVFTFLINFVQWLIWVIKYRNKDK